MFIALPLFFISVLRVTGWKSAHKRHLCAVLPHSPPIHPPHAFPDGPTDQPMLIVFPA